MKYEVWVLIVSELYVKELMVKDFNTLGFACSYACNLSFIVNVDEVKKVNVYSNDNGFRKRLTCFNVKKN